jgi:hypothetical protein
LKFKTKASNFPPFSPSPPLPSASNQKIKSLTAMSTTNSSEDAVPSREEVYKTLLRSLRLKKGFGIVFVQCSPAEAISLIREVEEDFHKNGLVF